MTATRPALTGDVAATARPARLAAIGLGGWSQAQAHTGSAYLVLPGCDTRDEGRRAAFAERFGCRPYASQRDLLGDPDVDRVIGAVPNDQHADVVAAAADAGKHVLVQKPLAVTVPDLARIRRAIESWGAVLACGHTARRLASVRQLKRKIDGRNIGTVTPVEAIDGNHLDRHPAEAQPELSSGDGGRGDGGPPSRLPWRPAGAQRGLVVQDRILNGGSRAVGAS